MVLGTFHNLDIATPPHERRPTARSNLITSLVAGDDNVFCDRILLAVERKIRRERATRHVIVDQLLIPVCAVTSPFMRPATCNLGCVRA